LIGDSVSRLTRKIRSSLDYLGHTPDWVPPAPGVDHNVAIVGGGQVGVAVAFALRRAGIGGVTVLDRADDGDAGIWRHHARMNTLRSAKSLGGPELGLPELTFRSWYEASFGRAAYRRLKYCPRLVWADYLDWYRETVGVEVRSRISVELIRPAGNGTFRIDLTSGDRHWSETARKIVLATGMAGSGRPAVPELFSTIPSHLFAHTDSAIDFGALRGKRVAVLGAASSAVDAAATALEARAAEVGLFSRHADLVRVTKIKAMAYDGVLDHFHHLADADRWSVMNFYSRRSAGPMPDTVLRATRFGAFKLHLSSPWEAAEASHDSIKITAGGSIHEFDFAILGTGYQPDLAARPELALFADSIALWRDRYAPPASEENRTLGLHPYLGHGYEFTGKQGGEDLHLSNIHNFNYGGILSHGRAVGDIVALKNGIPRLIEAIGRDLFLADRQHHMERLRSFDTADLSGAEYRHAIVDTGRK
jgi:cation diffusion facilitator CzcD-associated flavoprotein CzcO